MADPLPPAGDAACPICGRPTSASTRPFCSRRCAEVDLGRWFSGTYRVPSTRLEPEDEDEDRLPAEDRDPA
ncbi:DNA gyrase inhibitor YacG [Lichenicoccus roseus]|uniref:DNA gyrase inhibitor YacG n=1 Tax=Lichenicoccus roseus TaxID=2683649 RepID=A0A5R9JD54_9PROT|nr:DNA gyrase inhibitor YacG [Lichenicoccus roseus]TLU73541.1 DNA gyrase inhibitor YacG [Lichenicoccus roseus]